MIITFGPFSTSFISMFHYSALVIYCFLVSCGQTECSSEKEVYKQEAAKVEYYNQKYIKDIKVMTYRHSRQSPYLTSINCTILYTWENNVTVIIDVYSTKLKHEMFTLDFKLCDIIKTPWAKTWLKEYSNVHPECPVPAQIYKFKEIELPPRNFPVPIPAGDYSVTINFMITKTKERIVDIKVNLKFQGKKGK